VYTSTQYIEMPRSGLAVQIKALPPAEAAALIERAPVGEAVEALASINPGLVQAILAEVEAGARRMIIASAPPGVGDQWKHNRQYPAGTIGRLPTPYPTSSLSARTGPSQLLAAFRTTHRRGRCGCAA